MKQQDPAFDIGMEYTQARAAWREVRDSLDRGRIPSIYLLCLTSFCHSEVQSRTAFCSAINTDVIRPLRELRVSFPSFLSAVQPCINLHPGHTRPYPSTYLRRHEGVPVCLPRMRRKPAPPRPEALPPQMSRSRRVTNRAYHTNAS